MNVKLHTPKTLRAGSGMTSIKQFLLSLLATTISIVLTFGTAAVIDSYKKNAAKKEMVMMVISDFDKTIDLVQRADTSLCEARRLQQELAVHPEQFDSLRYVLLSNLTFIGEDFSETTEKIFSTSIETFNTIGDVNFVNEVSSFYLARQKFKEMILLKLKDDLNEHPVGHSLLELLEVGLPEYAYTNTCFLNDMKERRDRCMQMMNVSEEDMIAFNNQQENEDVDQAKDARGNSMLEEWGRYNAVIEQAKEKLKH